MVASNGQLPQIRKLQRTLAAQGWDPRDIAREIHRRFPGVSRFASWRYGYGWSSQRAADEIRRHYRLPSGSRRRDYTPGVDVTRLNEWEHWPGSGVRPGLLYLEAASRAYRVPISELGLDDGYHPEAGSTPHATIAMAPAVLDPALSRTTLHQAVMACCPPLMCRFAFAEQFGERVLRGWAWVQFQLFETPSEHAESPADGVATAEVRLQAHDQLVHLHGVGTCDGHLVQDCEGAVLVTGLTLQLSQVPEHAHDQAR